MVVCLLQNKVDCTGTKGLIALEKGMLQPLTVKIFSRSKTNLKECKLALIYQIGN